MSMPIVTSLAAFDPDAGPWRCPCGTMTDAIALTDSEGVVCPRDFQLARAAGRDPQFLDTMLA